MIPDAAALVLARLRAEGIEIVEGAAVERIGGRAGAIEVQVAGASVFMGTHLLMAVGRKPALERLNLAAAGVRTDKGAVAVDDRLRSSNRRVYAIGDAAGQGQFTYVAGYQAALIIRPLLFALLARARNDHIPHVTYTDPELAQIGPTESEARTRHGDALTVLRLGFDANDRAQAEGKTEGLIKVMAVRGRPVGVTIAGPAAGEMIGLWSLAIANRLGNWRARVAGSVLPYPTMENFPNARCGRLFYPQVV